MQENKRFVYDISVLLRESYVNESYNHYATGQGFILLRRVLYIFSPIIRKHSLQMNIFFSNFLPNNL